MFWHLLGAYLGPLSKPSEPKPQVSGNMRFVCFFESFLRAPKSPMPHGLLVGALRPKKASRGLGGGPGRAKMGGSSGLPRGSPCEGSWKSLKGSRLGVFETTKKAPGVSGVLGIPLGPVLGYPWSLLGSSTAKPQISGNMRFVFAFAAFLCNLKGPKGSKMRILKASRALWVAFGST